MTKRLRGDSPAGACGHHGQARTDHGGADWKGAWQDESWGRHTHEPWHAGRQDGGDADHDSLTVLIGGFAAAAGEVALTMGLVETVAQDRPGVSLAQGGAVFDAYGYAEQPGEAFAAANTYLQVIGADLVLRRESEGSGGSAGAAWAHSEIDYLAIDIDAWSPVQPIVIDMDRPLEPQRAWLATALATGLAAGPASVAAVAASVEALGVDALSSTSTHTFTESQFSFVHAMAMAWV